MARRMRHQSKIRSCRVPRCPPPPAAWPPVPAANTPRLPARRARPGLARRRAPADVDARVRSPFGPQVDVEHGDAVLLDVDLSLLGLVAGRRDRHPVAARRNIDLEPTALGAAADGLTRGARARVVRCASMLTSAAIGAPLKERTRPRSCPWGGRRSRVRSSLLPPAVKVIVARPDR